MPVIARPLAARVVTARSVTARPLTARAVTARPLTARGGKKSAFRRPAAPARHHVTWRWSITKAYYLPSCSSACSWSVSGELFGCLVFHVPTALTLVSGDAAGESQTGRLDVLTCRRPGCVLLEMKVPAGKMRKLHLQLLRRSSSSIHSVTSISGSTATTR